MLPMHLKDDGSTNLISTINVREIGTIDHHVMNINSGGNNNSDANLRDDEIHPQAVTVYSVLVTEDGILDSQQNQPILTSPQESQRSSKKVIVYGLVIAVAIIVCSAAVGIGVYCGAGKCGSSPTTKTLKLKLNPPLRLVQAMYKSPLFLSIH